MQTAPASFAKHTKKGEKPKNFVIFNQKGIDPISLDILARMASLRPGKQKSAIWSGAHLFAAAIENGAKFGPRLQLTVGGISQNSVYIAAYSLRFRKDLCNNLAYSPRISPRYMLN